MTSRKKHVWVLVLCVLALAVLIIFKPAYGWRLRALLAPNNIVSSDNPTLPAQNQALAAQLAELQTIAAQLPQQPENEIRAMVYSQYPFGFKNQLLVNAGTDQGVATGSAVTFQGIFIGTVSRVFDDSAVIQTVFDPSFKMPVRIGAQGTDALLVGGSYPEAGSIAKNAPIAVNDIVYTAAPGLPYALPIASVAATSTSPDNLFEQASLQFAYDINSIQTVFIDAPSSNEP